MDRLVNPNNRRVSVDFGSKHGFESDLERAVIISLPTIVAYLFVAMVPSFPLTPFGGID